MDLKNGDMDMVVGCDVEGENGKKDEALGDRAASCVVRD
jgi:hypothetical protein